MRVCYHDSNSFLSLSSLSQKRKKCFMSKISVYLKKKNTGKKKILHVNFNVKKNIYILITF